MKHMILLILPFILANCATDSSTWDKSFDPLDKPMYQKPTVEQMHNKNVGIITANPARQYDTPVDMW
jgi:hypothetical protein